MAARVVARKALSPSSARPQLLVRSFTTSTALGKTPALADIEPGQAQEFDNKQAAFRKATEEAKQAKREQDSTSQIEQKQRQAPSSSPTPSSPSDGSAAAAPAAPVPSDEVSVAGDIANKLGLGSLSTNTGKESIERNQGEAAKRRSKIGEIIYGTPEGRELDREIERSYSQLLARGKYVHSIVKHKVKPDKVDEYVALVGGWYPKVANNPDNHVHLVGSWRTEVGDCDTFVHIWEYQRYNGYHASLHSIANAPGFKEFDSQLRHLIESKESSLMQEFGFWPTAPPRQLGGLFELRSYTLHPGNLLEWETQWRKGLKARKEVMEGVGAWFVQVGELNTVYHLWQFANLEERKARREMSWGVPGWSDTVHKTVPLVQSMKSRILVPMPWSPVA